MGRIKTKFTVNDLKNKLYSLKLFDDLYMPFIYHNHEYILACSCNNSISRTFVFYKIDPHRPQELQFQGFIKFTPTSIMMDWGEFSFGRYVVRGTDSLYKIGYNPLLRDMCDMAQEFCTMDIVEPSPLLQGDELDMYYD